MIIRLFFILHLFFISNMLSAQKRQSIYLEIPNANAKSFNKKTIIETYILKTNNCQGVSINLSLDSQNNVLKNINISSKHYFSIFFLYNSLQNPSKKININPDKNFISNKELQSITIENLLEILKQFKEIYVVDENNNAKLVTYNVIESL